VLVAAPSASAFLVAPQPWRRWKRLAFGLSFSPSREDRCEVSPDRPCAWQLIYKRLKEIGQLDRLKELKKPKNWRSSQSGGCRKIVREDHRV
jgi:hypothetical protein